MYIPGRLRTASSPFSILIESESYAAGSGFFGADMVFLNVLSVSADQAFPRGVLVLLKPES